jgi:hypothetical protein
MVFDRGARRDPGMDLRPTAARNQHRRMDPTYTQSDDDKCVNEA